jgi:periplasmic protein TonB
MGMLSDIFVDHAADRTRGWRYAIGGDRAWLPVHPVGRPVTGQMVAERLVGTHQPPRAVPMPTITLSVLMHAAVLVLVTLLVHSRMNDAATETTGVQLVFVPAPAAAPAAANVMVATPPDRDAVAPSETAASPPPMPAEEPVSPQPPPPPAPVAEPSAAALPLPPPPAPAAPETVSKPPVAPARPTPVVHAPPPVRVVAARPFNPPAAQPATSPQPTAPAQAETRSTATGAIGVGAAAPIVPPRPVAGMDTNRAPAYPRLARERGEQGRVLLRVNVSADGSPIEVAVVQTSGHPSLDSAALAAIREWRFVPAMQAGRPVPAEADVPVRFRLDD